jgi:hypothetical protein
VKIALDELGLGENFLQHFAFSVNIFLPVFIIHIYSHKTEAILSGF